MILLLSQWKGEINCTLGYSACSKDHAQGY